VNIRVLGSAAGGGCPQWNCACRNCRGARERSAWIEPRTQECVAVSADSEAWFLLNASPEIRAQIESFPPLHPHALRDSPIQGILLTNGDLDHTLGLLSLRESHPLVVYATETVRRGFVESNVLYRTLQRFPGQVTWRTLLPGAPLDLSLASSGSAATRSGLTVEAFPVPGKVPVHLEGLAAPSGGGENVGLRIREQRTGRVLVYLSAVGRLTPEVTVALEGADAVFFDGTFWSQDELRELGASEKRASDMAHLPIGGPEGSLASLSGMRAPVRVYIHLNNTNPVLREDSPERAAVERAGWRIASDGMEIAL
jgi:pyrroloquinoline quinone biosynthesis protein B